MTARGTSVLQEVKNSLGEKFYLIETRHSTRDTLLGLL